MVVKPFFRRWELIFRARFQMTHVALINNLYIHMSVRLACRDAKRNALWTLNPLSLRFYFDFPGLSIAAHDKCNKSHLPARRSLLARWLSINTFPRIFHFLPQRKVERIITSNCVSQYTLRLHFFHVRRKLFPASQQASCIAVICFVRLGSGSNSASMICSPGVLRRPTLAFDRN